MVGTEPRKTVEQAIEAAKKAQEQCEAKQWTYTISGKEVHVRSQMQTILETIGNYMKIVGPLIPQKSPIVSLVWEWATFGLEVFIACHFN